MATARAREPGNAAWVLLLPLVLAGCASSGGGFFGTSERSPPPSPAFAPPPPNMNVVDFVGRWGYAAYHKDADRPRTEVAARGQCNNAYTIGRGPTGSVMMHLPDAREPQELRLKQGVDGKIYLGPEGPAPDVRDRLRRADAGTPSGRSGDGGALRHQRYVRCGAPGTAAAKRKAG